MLQPLLTSYYTDPAHFFFLAPNIYQYIATYLIFIVGLEIIIIIIACNILLTGPVTQS